MKPKIGPTFKPTISMANTTGNHIDPFDIVCLSGFRSAAHAQEFANRLLDMGLAELPAPFDPANAHKVM
jgi:hypothetical protein